MTLGDLLVALKDNTTLNVSLIESTNTPIITFNAGGYEGIESDLMSRIVDTITVGNNKLVTIKLTAVGG